MKLNNTKREHVAPVRRISQNTGSYGRLLSDVSAETRIIYTQ